MTIALNHLSKKYGSVRALDELSYTFTEGVYGILGPNGAGKSTLIGLLTDTLRRDTGSILYAGEDIVKMGTRYRRLLGYMSQNQGYYGQMSALNYLRYMAQLKELSKKEADAQIYELLSVLGLKGYERRKLGGYSGGMRQRIMIAQAMLGDPKIIILDEPTAGLDPSERIAIRNYIAEMAYDRMIIIATHIVTDIECIARQILIMQNGKLLRAQPPEELIASIEGKAWERICSHEEIASYQRIYGANSVFLRKEGQVLRVIEDDQPEGFTPITHGLGLDDVYLYYCRR